MEKAKYMGIWMDHTKAILIEYSTGNMISQTILSAFTHETKEETLHNTEKGMHEKEQHKQSEFFKRIGDVIKNYDEVLLFGPTTAKTELLNVLRADHHYDKIALDTKSTDHLTDHQQQAIVREHFANRIKGKI